MPLDPNAELLLAQLPPLDLTLSAQDLRRLSREGDALFMQMFPAPQVETEEGAVDTSFGPVPIRRYIPREQKMNHALVFFHGGGFVFGDLDSHHGLTARLCDTLGTVVTAVDYSLAPEAKFPQPVHECLEVTRAICGRVGNWGLESGVVVAGDSAGGNFAAVVSQLARQDSDVNIFAQVLYFPVVDMAAQTASRQEFKHGYLLDEQLMLWFGENYLNTPEDTASPLASPALARDLSGLPPALMVTAEYDPLRDEGEAYARALAQAGVPVRMVRMDGMIHGFMTVPLFRQMQEGLELTREFLAELEAGR